MEIKKKYCLNMAVRGLLILLLFMAGLFFFMEEKDNLLGKEPADVYDTIQKGQEPEPGSYVKINADAVLDWYAETKHTVCFIPAGKEKHCLVWLENDAVLSMTVNENKKDVIEGLIDSTYAWVSGETDTLPDKVEFQGKIKRIASGGSELQEYYRDALAEWNISEAGGFTIYDLTIDTTETREKQLLFLGILFLGILVLIWNTVLYRKKKPWNRISP